jgi:DNA-binding NarL/FixJ family response regulator
MNMSRLFSFMQPCRHTEDVSFAFVPAKTVVIAARSTEMVNGLATYCLSSEQYRVVGLARSTEALMKRVAEHTPDVVIMEYDISHTIATEAIRQVRQHLPLTALMVLGDYATPSLVQSAFEHGANAYLLAMPLKEHLLNALDRTHKSVCNTPATSVGRTENAVREYFLDKHLHHLAPILNFSEHPTAVVTLV